MFLEKVKDYINKNALCTTNKPIIVGFSGGPDSVALLCVLNALGYTCIAAHCNFHLRGEESDRDMNFAIDLAEKKQIPIKLVHFETKTYAANHHISRTAVCMDIFVNEGDRSSSCGHCTSF